DIVTQGQNEGYSYFGFTRGLAEGPNEWNRIAQLRVGPEAESDTELTDEMMDEPIALKEGYATSFKVGAGTFHVVVDLNAMTVTFSKKSEELKGDVNADGRVNVSDVSALINMILGITPKDEERADVNGDGRVNVSDVSALINIILGIN
ncbi:MAG: dockerin type I repeat-containing protein, partial [Muribaculaceae bacterium]|nr:dockerin type I repeat-containing protein [Muribaculaceae bacterium]